MPNEIRGYFKIWRRAREHVLWHSSKPFDRWHAWEYLISWAAFGRTERDFQRQIWVLDRGQHVTTIKQLQRDWGWRSWARVRNYLDDLKRMDMIREESERGCLLITLCNFDAWQGRGKLTGRQPANPPGDRREIAGTDIRRSRREEEGGVAPGLRPALTPDYLKSLTPAAARKALEAAEATKTPFPPEVEAHLKTRAVQTA